MSACRPSAGSRGTRDTRHRLIPTRLVCASESTFHTITDSPYGQESDDPVEQRAFRRP